MGHSWGDGDCIRGAGDKADAQTYLRDCMMRVSAICSACTAHPHSPLPLSAKHLQVFSGSVVQPLSPGCLSFC